MIQKISNQNKVDWVDDAGIQRESMNKTALNSFTVILVAQAKARIAKGEAIDIIAKSYNLPVETLQTMLSGEETFSTTKETTKVACACENDPKSDEATEAFKSLYQHRTRQESDVQGLVGHHKSIQTAAGARTDVTDIGGPKKQMKFQSSNSIWDSEVLDRQLKSIGNDERIKAENKAIDKQREDNKFASRYTAIDGTSLEEALKKTDIRKDIGVQNLSVSEAHKYSKKLPMSGMSIFDTKEFERIPDKTAGEVAAQNKKAESDKPKDRSWVNNTKSVTTKDLFNSMIDSLTEKE